MNGDHVMERYIPSFLRTADVSRAEFHAAQDPTPDKGFVGAINELFTNHIVSMITATLICFTAFMGLTRMRTKHAAILAPINAIWFTYLFTATSAGTIVLGLAGTATAASIASYFFRSRASDAASVVGETMAQGARGVARSVVSPTAVAEQLMGRESGKKGEGSIPAVGEATRTVLEQVQEQRRAPTPPTVATTAPESVVVPERTEAGSLDRDGLDFDRLVDEYEEAERGLPRPQTDPVLDSAWREATAPRSTSDAWASEFLSQNPDARQMVASIPREQLHSFDEVWGMVQRQKPGAQMNEPWVQEFMSEQCRRKGLPWGKIAKYTGVAAVTVAAGYGLYRLYEYMTTPAEEEREEEKPKVATETSRAPAITAQELGKKIEALPLKQKQTLAMHLLFGQSAAAKAFKGALKRHVEKTKATAAEVEAPRTIAPVEQQVEKKDTQASSAARRLEVFTRHTGTPVVVSRDKPEEVVRPLTDRVITKKQPDPQAIRRLERLMMYRGRCGVPMQPGFGHPPRVLAKL